MEMEGDVASIGALTTGKVRRIDIDGAVKFDRGDILVTNMTDPDLVSLMRRAGAIVTFVGGRTCHAAIVSRELGVPCIVNCPAANQLKTGDVVTVETTSGRRGTVRRAPKA